MRPSRRGVLTGAGMAGLAAAPVAAGTGFDDDWHQEVLERYAGFGDKTSGGPGDEAVGVWLESCLAEAGYDCVRQPFETPFFDIATATLAIEGSTASIIPQAVVVSTGPDGLTAPLRLAFGTGRLDGAIAVIVLPSQRWSSALHPTIRTALTDVQARGAAAAVLVTTGPTGDALALNAPSGSDPYGRPVAVLAPRDAGPFLDAAAHGRTARLTVAGRGGLRPAWNLIGRRKAGGSGKTLVLSTPRSGWFGCAAERGSGIAVWLAAALWLARRGDVDVELVATSGHEYENLGGAAYLEHVAAVPTLTRLWVHVGANLAARDWHEWGERPLPGLDSQRYLLADPDVLDVFRRAFAGQPGLEAVYPATVEGSAGELTNILRAGHRAVGFFGNHRFHHSRRDDMRCVSGTLVRPASEALRRALAEVLAA